MEWHLYNITEPISQKIVPKASTSCNVILIPDTKYSQTASSGLLNLQWQNSLLPANQPAECFCDVTGQYVRVFIHIYVHNASFHRHSSALILFGTKSLGSDAEGFGNEAVRGILTC
jgi:hypothetical protein